MLLVLFEPLDGDGAEEARQANAGRERARPVDEAQAAAATAAKRAAVEAKRAENLARAKAAADAAYLHEKLTAMLER